MNSGIQLNKALAIDGWMSEIELKFLAERAKQSSVVIEVGSHKGRSSRALADNCNGTVYCIDPWRGPYYTKDNTVLFESGDHILGQFLVNLDGADNVKICRGDLSEYVDKLPFADFIFLDGDHRTGNVLSDIKYALRLIHPDGIIAGHDYTHTDWPGVKEAVGQIFGDDIKQIDSIWYKEMK